MRVWAKSVRVVRVEKCLPHCPRPSESCRPSAPLIVVVESLPDLEMCALTPAMVETCTVVIIDMHSGGDDGGESRK